MAFRGDMPIEATLLESELRLRVQRRIDGGRLPVALVSRTDSSYGTGNVCCACDQPITSDNVEYEIVDNRNTNCLCLSFHSSCHVIWQQECAHRIADAKRTKPRDDPRISQVTTSVVVTGAVLPRP
jgi:hypothetical protein